MPGPALILTLDALHEAAALFDVNGNVVHCNQAAEQLFGWIDVEETTIDLSGDRDRDGSPERRPLARRFSSMLSFPLPKAQPQPQDAHPASDSISGGGVSRGANQPSLRIDPNAQETWEDVFKSLPLELICQREGVGFRHEAIVGGGDGGGSSGSNRNDVETVPFPVSVNLLKLCDASFARTYDSFNGTGIGAAGANTDADVDEKGICVCAFISELTHVENRMSGQLHLMSDVTEHNDRDAVGALCVDVEGGAVGEGNNELEREVSLLDDKFEPQSNHSLMLSIIEASFDAMFYINERGIIQMVNGAAVDQFGWSRSEFLGSNISCICGGGRAPDHDNYIKRYLRTGEKRVMGKKRELIARRRDGSEFPIELGLTEVKVREGEERSFCGFVRNLSREKEQEMEVKRRQRLTTSIIDAAFDAMFAINEKGIINMVNNAAIEQFGWSREEFIGSNIRKIVGGSHAENHDIYIQRYLRTGEKRVMGVRRELPARRKDGTEFPIELGLAEVKVSEGEEREFVGFVRDISLQKKQEAELIEKQSTTEGLIEASLDAMFAIDEQCRIQTVNNAAVNQFGWSREELIGENIRIIMGPDHARESFHLYFCTFYIFLYI